MEFYEVQMHSYLHCALGLKSPLCIFLLGSGTVRMSALYESSGYSAVEPL